MTLSNVSPSTFKIILAILEICPNLPYVLESACQFLKNLAVVFIKISLNMQINLGRIYILKTLSLPIQEHGISFYLFKFNLVALSNIL